MQLYAPDIFSIFKPVSTMIDYFSADNNSSFNENTLPFKYLLQKLTYFQNLTISIFLGTVKTNFIQIMCEKRDRSTPEVSVFGSENSVHPW